MIKFWIGNEFPIDLILDLGNFSFFCIIFFFIHKRNLITQNMFFILCALMLTPFLFNNEIVNWKLNPDQSKYLSISNNIREEMSLRYFVEINDIRKLKVIFTGYIFAFSPLLNIETFKSIGFLNRFILVSSIFYFFKKKKISLILFLITVLSPSLTYFSSVSLREILIISSMLWSVFFILEKKYILFILPCIILLFIKFQNLIIVLFFAYLYLLLNFKNNKKLILINLLILPLLLLITGDSLISTLNEARRGLYLEEFGAYKGLTSIATYQEINFNFELIAISLKSLFFFILSPIFDASSWMKIIALIEIFILYAYFLKEFFMVKTPIIRDILYFWLLILIFSFTFYSLAIFNDGTIHRYRIGLMFFILIGYNMHKLKFNNK